MSSLLSKIYFTKTNIYTFVRYSEAFQSGAKIHGGGVMVLGQEQDALGGSLSPEEAFIGDLSQLNVWNKVLSPQDIYNLVRSCNHVEHGNVKAWADFREGLQGVYKLTSKSHACNCELNVHDFVITEP